GAGLIVPAALVHLPDVDIEPASGALQLQRQVFGGVRGFETDEVGGDLGVGEHGSGHALLERPRAFVLLAKGWGVEVGLVVAGGVLVTTVGLFLGVVPSGRDDRDPARHRQDKIKAVRAADAAPSLRSVLKLAHRCAPSGDDGGTMTNS